MSSLATQQKAWTWITMSIFRTQIVESPKRVGDEHNQSNKEAWAQKTLGEKTKEGVQ